MGDKKMKIECEKCHKIMQVPRSDAIRLNWYKRECEDVRILCPDCYNDAEKEFQKAGDRIAERCKNLIKKLDEEIRNA